MVLEVLKEMILCYLMLILVWFLLRVAKETAHAWSEDTDIGNHTIIKNSVDDASFLNHIHNDLELSQ